MAARQVLQATADQDATALARLIGIGEIHVLFRQQRAQMSVNLLQRGVFETLHKCGFAASLSRFRIERICS